MFGSDDAPSCLKVRNSPLWKISTLDSKVFRPWQPDVAKVTVVVSVWALDDPFAFTVYDLFVEVRAVLAWRALVVQSKLKVTVTGSIISFTECPDHGSLIRVRRLKDCEVTKLVAN